MEQSGGFRGALARLRSAPLWVWITVLLTFGLLIFAFLQYRKSSAASSSSGVGGIATSGDSSSAGQGVVPTNGAGQPMWNTADQGAFVAGNVTDIAALLSYLQSNQTPNPTPTATPNPPTPTPTTGTTITPTGSTGSAAKFFTITQNYSAANWKTTTLSGIAQTYHTTVANLQRLNPQISNPNLVYKGEKIRVA